MSLEFIFIIRQSNFQFQNQYPNHKTAITISVYHFIDRVDSQDLKKVKTLILDEQNRKEANDKQITKMRKMK